MVINQKSIIIAGIIIMFFIIFMIGECQQMELRRNHAFNTVKIESVSITKGKFSGSADLQYTAYINGIKYTWKAPRRVKRSFSKHASIVGKYFPIAYNPNSFGVHDLLITKRDFMGYGLIQPDSLKWANAIFE